MRIGYYCWAGENTARMIRTKYFKPQIDENSLMYSYEYDYLKDLKEKVGRV